MNIHPKLGHMRSQGEIKLESKSDEFANNFWHRDARPGLVN